MCKLLFITPPPKQDVGRHEVLHHDGAASAALTLPTPLYNYHGNISKPEIKVTPAYFS